jgi:hypothetical protein
MLPTNKIILLKSIADKVKTYRKFVSVAILQNILKLGNNDRRAIWE